MLFSLQIWTKNIKIILNIIINIKQTELTKGLVQIFDLEISILSRIHFVCIKYCGFASVDLDAN